MGSIVLTAFASNYVSIRINPAPHAIDVVETSTEAAPPTFTPLPTHSPSITASPLPTETALPGFTPTEPATATPLTPTPPPVVIPIPITPSPITPTAEIDINAGEASFTDYTPVDGELWIDINLSSQMLYVYQGNQQINSFLMSSGTSKHPTVTGQYRIYLKFRADDMQGPGYYLTNVPYVMYFYKGYGIHGTYWHSNFGTPMSHGCINLPTEDAKWLFERASEGTLVNIHY
ncbi:MAG: L,D-transpeptidase [Anaerolineae bacterium]|nr:L,D-transpeptidase [Anaerolineae bacterium]